MLILFGSPGCGSAVVEVILQFVRRHAMFDIGDEPSRWADGEAAQTVALTEQRPPVAGVWEKNFGK